MPERDDILPIPPAEPGEKIAYGSDPLQFGELRVPSGAGRHPVVVVIHGGFWRAAYNLDHIGHLCMALTAAGVATWSLEYRRLGNAGGGWPGTFEDIAAGTACIDTFAERYRLDRSCIVTLGHSAGGQLALWVATRRKLAGMVSLAGVVDLKRAYQLNLSNGVVADLLGGSPDSTPERYAAASPVELLPLHSPQRLIHGTADSIVPFEISQHYVDVARIRGDDAQLLSLEGTGHFELIDPRSEEFHTVQTTVLRLCETN